MKPSRIGAIVLGLALLALMLALALSQLLGAPGKSDETATPRVTPLFDLVLADLQGKPQNLGQWRGKLLVVNYWATWCLPCREEMPGFSRLQDKYRDKGVQFVGISIDTPDKIYEFQKTTPVTYPLLIGDIGVMENSAALGNTRQALPFTAVFDHQGKLVLTKLGRLPEADLERQLIELIERHSQDPGSGPRASGR